MLRFTAAGMALFSSLALAQNPDRSLTFDVASIKPAAQQPMGRMMMGTRGGPGTSDPGQVRFMNMSLDLLIANAYDVKTYQISGPSWMGGARFDVTAKVPEGATKEQYQVMLQNLLADRFKLVAHKEKKQLPIYALMIGKGGPKLKESAAAPADAGEPKGPPPDPQAMGRDGDPKPQAMGKDGFPKPPAGARGMMAMFNGHGFRIQANQTTTTRITEMLADLLGRPVIDETALKAQYDFTLDFSPEGLTMMRGVPMPMGPPPGGMAGGGPDSGREGGREAESGPTIFSAVQEQLGLKLESRKGPVELIVVESVEKTPTEN
jgi:uncharacterized protein (TIGR03435 family)